MDHKNAVEKRLYNIHEAAESLGMSEKSIRNLVTRGLLKPKACFQNQKLKVERVSGVRSSYQDAPIT